MESSLDVVDMISLATECFTCVCPGSAYVMESSLDIVDDMITRMSLQCTRIFLPHTFSVTIYMCTNTNLKISTVPALEIEIMI